jgi:hypothetical protein
MKLKSIFKTVCFIICFFVFQISCNNKSTKAPENSVTFKLETLCAVDSLKIRFKPVEYNLALQNVFVLMEPSSGINISWFSSESDSKKISLNLFLPSKAKFKIFSNKYSDIIYEIPTLPFTISDAGYTEDLKQENKTYFYLKREYVDELGHVKKTESVNFSEFTLNVSEFKFDRNNLIMQCKFRGAINKEFKNLYDADYRISGEFSIKSYNVGIMDAGK